MEVFHVEQPTRPWLFDSPFSEYMALFIAPLFHVEH